MRVEMGSNEEWKKAAMEDDAVVAELLLHLNKAPQPMPPAQQPQPPPPKPVLALGWSVRQRRSKAVSVSNYAKKLAAPRASPSTPLSWSGATSLSGGGGGGGDGVGSGSVGVGVVDGGSEESSKPQPLSHPKRVETTRSKVTGEATTSKRPRKKKTLAELKEEENVLLKERRHLKKELMTLRVNLEKERARNENLKRMELDVQPQMANERGTTVSTQEAISRGSSDPPPPVVPTADPGHAASLQFFPPESSCFGQKEVAKFVLPDLNLPFEDDCSTKVLCGVS